MAGERIVLVWILGLMCWTQGRKVNIALKKRAWTTLQNYPQWTADKAVDGDNSFILSIPNAVKTCFHGAGNPSDWTVDLGQEYQLYDIRVYIWKGRESRTADSIIYLDRSYSRICYNFPSAIFDNPTDVTCNGTARYVTIRNPGKGPGHTDALTICEVEIYGCSVGTYGIDCTSPCGHCSYPSCDRWTGVCRGVCVAGYRGYKCNRMCDSTTYGVNCNEKCVDRKCNTNTTSCDRVTGSCDTGCLPGWMETDCTEECRNQRYGSSCSSFCEYRNCDGISSCNHVTGSCDQGCKAGWGGIDCKQVCSNTTYGANCKWKCLDRKCNTNTTSCDRVTGSCDTGCLPGWTRSNCTEECGNKYYGSNCSYRCAHRHCSGNSTCDHVTGACSQGCKAGWIGIDCKQACDDEHYGPNCNRVCSTRHCEVNSTCSPSTGQCDGRCQSGWKGIDCADLGNMLGKTIIPDLGKSGKITFPDFGKSGKNDLSRLWKVWKERSFQTFQGLERLSVFPVGNSSCNPVTGSCDQGCRQGWNGVDCRQDEMLSANDPSVQANSPSVPSIVGGVIGAVILILVLVLVIVLIRRRGKPFYQHGLTKSDEPHVAKVNSGQGPCDIYENVPRDADGKKPAAAAATGLVHLNGHTGDASKVSDSKSVITLEEEEDDNDSPVLNTQLEEEPGLHERNYYNMDDISRDHIIPVSQLVVRVREFEEKTELSKAEFQQLPDTFLHPYDESQKPGSKAKNRFKGFYPYNYNRVVLHGIGDGGKSDYINASYLDGYNEKKRYIAAQGPYKDDIVEDFWRMIWQEGCRVAVMVTGLVEGGKMKCLRYWPETGSITYGDVTVTMETETKLADYTITKLAVQNEKASKKRHVNHFHFTTWPDHGVPDTSCLLQYMWRINSTSGQKKHPIVVHCSAGIGQTGTYIAVESLVGQAMREGTVDVVSFVSNMRSQRKNMIQTKEQYQFIYQAVMAAVVEGDSSLDADVIRLIDLGHVADVQMGNKTVQQHLEVMASSAETGTSDDIITIPSYASRMGFFVKTSRPDKEELWNQIYNSGSRTLVTWELVDKSYLPTSDRPVSTSMLTATMRSFTLISNQVTLSEVKLNKKDDKNGILIHNYHVTGCVRDPCISVLIDSLLQWTGQPECESTTIVSHSISETRLLILFVNIASRLQDDGKVDVISNMRRLQSLLGGPRFTTDDVRLCMQFSQRRLESLGTYEKLSDFKDGNYYSTIQCHSASKTNFPQN